MQKILIAVLFLVPFFTNAQDTVRADAEITNATVYFGYGAEPKTGGKQKSSN